MSVRREDEDGCEVWWVESKRRGSEGGGGGGLDERDRIEVQLGQCDGGREDEMRESQN